MSTPTLGYPQSFRLARSPIFITGKNNTLANDALNAMTLEISTYTEQRPALQLVLTIRLRKLIA